MNNVDAAPELKPSPEVRAEAALWLAHLRGPERDADVEQGFRLWLKAKPEHALAFELASDLWEKAGAVRRRPHEKVSGWWQPNTGHPRRFLAAAAMISAVAVVATLWALQRDRVVTTVGEQRIMTLEDGTRVFFNTDTRADVRYRASERRIQLDQGEALFDVAKHAGRPFIVDAGGTQIEALGTSFVVRRDSAQLAVTLLDGKVSVRNASNTDRQTKLPETMTLLPGQRLTMSKRGAPVVDTPVIDKLTAWQRGQVAFDNVLLTDAVAEMNRYSAVKLAVALPETGNVLIGGVFRTGDAASFAQAMAATYGLRVVEEHDQIILGGLAEARVSR